MRNYKKVLSWIMAVCLLLTWNISVYGEQTSEKTGQRSNVVLFVQFPEDETADFFNTHQERLTYDKGSELLTGFAAYERILNGRGERNRSSLATYIDAVSEGKLKIKNVFPQYNGAKIVPITMEHSVDYYDSYEGEARFLEEAVSKAGKLISPSEKVDQDGDQVVDNLLILVHHRENSSRDSVFYPHKADSPGGLSLSGKYVGPYVLINTGNLWNTVEKQGLVCHEFFHTLGLPDLYRNQNSAGTINYPVESWDIMARSSMYLQYPLSWQRKQLGWIDLPEQNKSGTYKLYAPGTEGKDYSFVIKSPMSDTEFFVVEYRKKGESISEELDVKIPGSGLIIYRVDTTKEEVGNIAGDDYLYVFRPENRDNVSESFLSKNSGRTSFGTSDWSKGVKDNAITYSDGSNSGIVIDQVGEAADSITFRMTIPDYEELSLWNRTFAKAGTGRYDTISSKNEDVYFAAENQQGIEVKKRAGNVWTEVGSTIPNAYSPKLAAVGNDIYLVYTEGREFHTVISKFKDGSWNPIFTSEGTGNGKIAVAAYNHSIYVAFDEGDKLIAKRITDTLVEDFGTVSEGLTAIADPGMTLYQGEPVLVFRDIFGDTGLQIKNYVDGKWSLLRKITTDANSFSCCSDDNRLYISGVDRTGVNLYEYDKKQWKEIDTSPLPKGSGGALSMYQGQLLIGRLEDGQKTAKCYVRKNETWSQLGNYITKAAEDSECKFAVAGTAVYGAVNCSNGLGIFLKSSEGPESGNTGNPSTVTTAVQTTASTVASTEHGSTMKPTNTAGTTSTTSTTESSSTIATVNTSKPDGTYSSTATTSSQKNTSAKPKPTKSMTYRIVKEAKIRVSWKKTKGRSGYVIYAKRGKKGRYKRVKTVKKQTKATLLLESGSKYYFKVKPYRVKNKKRRYDKMRKAKGGKPLNSIRVTYSNISGYQGYVVEMKTGSGKYKKVKETSRGGTICFEKKKINPKKKYQFRLKGFHKVRGKRIYTQISVKKK